MCGLVGILYDDGQTPPDPDQLRRMVAVLGHRGPDGEGIRCEAGIGFGHARLSVIDLAGGAQPIYNEDGSIWIVYNGEIFNHQELRDELTTQGHRFYTASDTEVIVHLYEALGDAFVERLNGQFAFAIWDGNRKRLVLARDRAGILPLYWCRLGPSHSRGPGIAFASEVKALFAGGAARAEADPEGLDELWTFWAPIAPRTAFLGIEQLRPGELMTVSKGNATRRQYWHWTFPSGSPHRQATIPSLSEELTVLLEDATRIRLRADVPVAAYLSGGLDSSSLVAVLKRSITKSLHTFSIGFDDPGLDESVHQRAIVNHLGTKHHHTQCSLADIADSFSAVIWHTESPTLRSAPAPMRMLSKSVHDAGFKVVLSGEGADEVLGGYDIFKEAKVRRFWSRNPNSPWRPRLLKRLYPYLDFSSAQRQSQAREFFGQGIANADDPFFSHAPRWNVTAQCKLFWSQEFAAGVISDARDRLRESLPAEFGRWHPFNRAEYLESHTLLPGYLLSTQGDRMLMANSVEGRFPFLDHRLIEFANMLPPKVKMRVLEEKHLLRQAMRRTLPPDILGRRKQPYRAPDSVAFLGDRFHDYVTELMSAGMLKRFGYFDPSRVGLLVAKLSRTKTATARENMAFMGILSTQLWHQEFIER